MERIGFIGLGIMGKPMAARLVRAGFPVAVHNRSPEAADELAATGAEVAGSPREVAERSDVVVTMLRTRPTCRRSCSPTRAALDHGLRQREGRRARPAHV